MNPGAFPRAEHPHWELYPLWNAELKKVYQAAVEEHWDNVFAQRREQAEAALIAAEQRRLDYAEWLRTSPEWRELRALVMRRSRQICEACLNAPATVVHHLTYALGRLPPAWHLKAICDECHDRMHNGSDEWCEYGMARNS